MSAIYRLLRLLGDARAVSRGPSAVGRRLARRKAFGLFARALRKAGL